MHPHINVIPAVRSGSVENTPIKRIGLEMNFPAKIRNGVITIPKPIRQYMKLQDGDTVLIEIISQNETDRLKGNLEQNWKRD